jgi:hypothetical protein
MFDGMSPVSVVLVITVGSVVFLAVGTVLFRAGCALADVPEPGLLKSLVLFTLASVVTLPLLAGLVWYAGSFESDPNARLGPMRILALAAGLLLTWVLSALLYAGGIPVRPRKSLMIAGSELVLMGLLGTLLSAVVLVVLAVVQIRKQPAPSTRISRAAPVWVIPAAREPS